MRCTICNQQPGVRVCADCGKRVCADCSAAFPHHDPPHVRCETCYQGGERRARRNRERRGYDEHDDSHDADWWKGTTK